MTFVSLVPARLALVAVAVAVLTAAGCSGTPSSSPPPTTAPPTTAPATTAPATTAPATTATTGTTGSAPTTSASSSAAQLPSVCDLVPASTVAALIGTPVTPSSSTFTEVNTHKPTADCSYAYGSGDAVNVNVTPGATAQDFHADAYAAGLSPTPISGLGSLATTDETVGLHVLSGTNLINVQGTPQQANGDFSAEVQIAKDLIAALPH